MIKLKSYWMIVLIMAGALWSCQEDEELNVPNEEEKALMEFTDQVMQEWYLWNDELPEVNLADYASADELLDALRNPLDRWSYIEEEETYDNFFNNAQYEGYGFRMEFDEEEKLRVAFTYRDSPFGELGVDRSWTINKINGKTIPAILASQSVTQEISNPTNTFELIDDQGNIITKTLTKATIGINTVLHHQIFEVDGTKVGYLVFNSFLATSIDELRPVFQEFQQAGIQELILDLRYNGGGRVNVAEYMAANIVGSQGSGRNFIEYIYNEDKAAAQNESVPFETADSPLSLDRLITITSGNTASASELVINGLRPFMEVVVIGDNTHGKPVGSRPFRSEGYALNPIIFKIANDDGEGEYYQGFPADSYISDDLGHKFGDPEESRLKEALYFLETGLFSTGSARLEPSTGPQIRWKGFRQEIGAY
ncbi:MAG: S41 family peptidase [Cyclobacteriaceae bacterium]